MGRILRPSRPLRSGDSLFVVRTGLTAPFEGWGPVHDRLSSVGLSPVFCDSPASSSRDSPERARMRQFLAAVTEGEAAGVLSYRGGAGAIRLLGAWETPGSPFLRGIPVVCGFSDMTYLHAALTRKLSLGTFWGPNARELRDDVTFGLWWEMVSGKVREGDPLPLGAARVLRPGHARGRLAGGNLESLAHLAGTPFFPDLSETILLIEDVDEPLYAVDRALRTLSLSGALDRLAGIVVGPFSGWSPRDDDPAPSVADLVLSLVAKVPVMEASLPGHGTPMATWPLNVPVHLGCSPGDPPYLVLLDSPFETP